LHCIVKKLKVELMKKTIIIFLLLTYTKGFCQIYFSPNTDMYVKNEVLYVEQNIDLNSNSILYLRNNSQLLQGTTGFSSNTGSGKLSVYQEGTSDNFDYNYWCSPVGNASVTSGNENFGITMLNRPNTSIVSTPSIILAASNYDGISNPLSISSTWIYKLINANSYSQWIYVGGATTLAPGEGFSMKGTSGTDTTDPEGTGITNNSGGNQRYDFRGKPNDGNITIPLGANNATLTGNPYPSALHLNNFLLDPSNTATGGIAYFWEQDKTVNSHTLIDYRGGYGSYAPVNLVSSGIYVPATFNSYNDDGTLNTTGSSSGLVIDRQYSPIGQGFVISAVADGTATFKNAHRVFIKEATGSSQFEKQAPQVKSNKTEKISQQEEEKISHFKLNTIINSQYTRQLALAFIPEATAGVDKGIDALNMNTSLPNDVTFWLENRSYVIQGINFDEEKKIPLAIKTTTNTNFKFYISELVKTDFLENIYIYDALDESYHDIKNGTYEVNVSPGVYNDRFKIAFKNQTLGIDDAIITPFFISQENSINLLKIFNPNNLELKSLKLFDILGKVMISKKDLGANQNYSFSTNGLSKGIYIVELLTTDNKKIIQKIIITNAAN
jgi:hypothetical protein